MIEDAMQALFADLRRRFPSQICSVAVDGRTLVVEYKWDELVLPSEYEGYPVVARRVARRYEI